MPDSAAIVGEKRLDVWRRSILLFDRTTADTGPFYQAGYQEFTLEPRLEDGSTPDIAASSGPFYVFCDVSFSANKEGVDLRKYRDGKLTPALRLRLAPKADARPGGAPFLLTTARGLRDFPADLNAINVLPAFDRHVENVDDARLKAALDAWHGFSRPPPNYSLLALPESDPNEVKLQLAGLLKQRASVGESLSAAQATEHLLGDLFDAFPQAARGKLSGMVADLLNRAVAYIDGASFRQSDKTLILPLVDSSSGRKAFDRKLAGWSGTPFIEDWYVPEEGEETGLNEDDAGDTDE